MNASADITVVTPTIPPRTVPGGLLGRAVDGVREQRLTPTGGHVVVLDVDKAGAAVTRQRGLDAVRTEWVAFLDDDDYWYPSHLEVLWSLARRGAWYAWSWFDGNNPFPGHRGRAMDPGAPHHTTMTVLVKTELAVEAGFLQPDGPMHAEWAGEDWQFELRCLQLVSRWFGVDRVPERMLGSPEVTWHYRVHSHNTSGLASRW